MSTTPQQPGQGAPQQQQQQRPLGATQPPLKPQIPAQQLNSILTDTLRARLLTTPCKALAPNFQNVIFAKSNDSVGYVFKKLIDCGILSMPVLDVETNNFVAFVDMLDVLAWIVSVGQLPTDPGALYKEWQQRVQLFETTQCSELLKRAQRHPWLTLSRDLPLQKAIDFMVQHHAHRIGLVQPDGTFSSILTQHRIIKWLAGMEQTDMGARLASSSIGQLGIGFRTVLTVKRDQPVFAAFLTMYNQRVSGVAVTDDANTFLGNISVSDLKDIGHVGQNYDKLFMSAGNFLSTKSEGLGVPTVVYATRNASLKEVLGKFKSFFVHRVYIVEKGSHKLEGVITPSDILQLFTRASRTTVVTQPQQQQEQLLSPSETEFTAFMNQLETMGGLLPLMLELMGGPEFSMFGAPEYGAFPSEPIFLSEREPFFGTVVPPTPFARTQPLPPARIDVVEDIKIVQKHLPPGYREGTPSPSQQNA